MSGAVRLALVLAFVGPPASAFDFVVTRYDDPVPSTCAVGDCSLREALIGANVGAALDRILLSAGTYQLAQAGSDDNAIGGDLDVLEDVEVVGPGAGMTAINGNQLGAVFQVRFGVTLTLRGLTVQDGSTISGSSFGVHVLGSEAILEDCEVRGDQPGTTGTAILVVSSGALTLRRTTVTGSPGNGVQLSESTATIENSTVAANAGTDLIGISSSSFVLRQSTIHDPADSSDELSLQVSSTATFENSIVAGNCSLSSSTVTSLDGNLETPGTSCGFGETFDQSGVTAGDANLGALAANGGSTRTVLPLAGSFAIDAAFADNCLSPDQRGVVRPVDGDGANGAECDAGAVEVSDTPPFTPIFSDTFEQGSTGAWS